MLQQHYNTSYLISHGEIDGKELFYFYLSIKLTYGKFISYKEFLEYMASLDLDDKIEISHRVIEESIRITRTLFKDVVASVGFSGGKASLVVLDLILHHIPKDEVFVIYANTLNDYPETRDYVLKLVKGFYRIKYFVEVVPKITPWHIWRIFGFPRESRDRYYTPVCCILLKELPIRIAIERYGINVDYNGIQASESITRFRSLADNGLVRRTKYIGREVVLRRAIVRVAPIGLWSDSDIWTYIRERRLPTHPGYEKYGLKRLGCVACTNTKNWEDHIERYSISLLKFVKKKIKEWGIQKKRIRYKDILKLLNIKDIESLYIVREHFS